MEPEKHEPPDRGLSPSAMRYLGLGMEFTAGIVGCTLLGYWIDRGLGSGNTGTIVGALIGCVGGMYYLIRRAIQMQREAERAAKRDKRRDDREF